MYMYITVYPSSPLSTSTSDTYISIMVYAMEINAHLTAYDDQIRGHSYEETLMIPELMPYQASYDILKLVYSAAANANHNKGLSLHLHSYY
ncbi:putative ribosomal protein L22/L17 [Rosa chinensis]|uniref:Putative ribosomal protein L22/L17 n=1 Tax=Rosa chinensis TaxID=74649 RepID=A0A2P6Q8P2_ROSCH|nr:putative ribosomal protein L22/L17 [Rosa chinensis]